MSLLYNSLRRPYKTAKLGLWRAGEMLTDFYPKLAILAYHRILPCADQNFLNPSVSFNNFQLQLEAILKHYEVISLNDAINQLSSGSAFREKKVVLTFDDGFRDNFEIAFPYLVKNSIPATFFLATDYVGKNRPIWYCELVKILYNNTKINSVNLPGRQILINRLLPRHFFIREVAEEMKTKDEHIRENVLHQLRQIVDERFLEDLTNDICITWDNARTMISSGMEIGCHGASHSSLSRMPFQQACLEIEKSKNEIERESAMACLYFAFPFGSKNDFNEPLVNYLKKIGFKACLLNIHGYNRIKKNAFCFKRIIIDQNTRII